MNVNEGVDRLFDIENQGPALEAIWLSHIQAYFQCGGDITAPTERNGWQLIHIAALNGLDEVVAWLVAHGADINARDRQGSTPLLLAFNSDVDGAVQGGREVSFVHSQRLIALGADKTMETDDGESMESTASAYGKKMYAMYQKVFG